MSGHRKFKTAVTVTVAGVEQEWPATIVYACHDGYAGDRYSPPEPATVEIVAIKLLGPHGVQIDLPAAVEDALNDHPDIIAQLMDDWREDAIAAAEYRAEMQAEARAMGDA